MTTEPTHVERGRGTHPDARVKLSHLSGYPEGESNPQRRRYIGDGHQARANKASHLLNR